MRLRLLVIFLINIGSWSGPVGAATIELAKSEFQKPLRGVTVEGNIEPGDSTKLLSKLLEYAFIYNPDVARIVFLRSKGGDVLEAMKMGKLVRQLRLVTNVPTKLDIDRDTFCTVAVADKGNCTCASACFLAYAGGVERNGNVLALHRPSLPREEARKLSDREYEALQKDIMMKASDYLRDMEVNQFFIDKMMSNSSQDIYFVTRAELQKYNLNVIVPTIQEIVLTKCNVLTSQENQLLDTTSAATPEGRQLRSELVAKLQANDECSDKVLQEIRRAAFQREMKAIGAQP